MRAYYKIREGRVRKRIFEMVEAVGAASHAEVLSGRRKRAHFQRVALDGNYNPLSGSGYARRSLPKACRVGTSRIGEASVKIFHLSWKSLWRRDVQKHDQSTTGGRLRLQRPQNNGCSSRRPESRNMPLKWIIDHEARLVQAGADGTLTAADVRDFLTQIAEAGAMSYGKLFDGSGVTHAPPIDELKSLGSLVRQFAVEGRAATGPLAIVVPHTRTQLQAAHYADAAGSSRPVQIFRHRAEAQRWLRDQRNRVSGRRR